MSTSTTNAVPSKRWPLWLLLLLVVIVAVVVVAVPVFVIMPFKAQTAAGVEWSYRLRRWSPYLTPLATLAALALAFPLWRGGRWVTRLALVVLFVPLLGVTWFARQNHFEWMFAPLSALAHAPASTADFINDQDMVMAIELNGEAVAYPIRQMAYHHVVNDVVGGRPITATY